MTPEPTKSALLILHPRQIPRCVESFEALKGIDKIWFVAHTEQGLEEPITRFIEETNYRSYLLCGDDVLADQRALDLVLKALEDFEAVTGYCNVSAVGDMREYANVTRQPLEFPEPNGILSYRFARLSEIEAIEQPSIFRTYFMGTLFTGMRRELWKRFPFRTYPTPPLVFPPGYASDYRLSYRLQSAGVEMVAPKGAFSRHLGGGGSEYRAAGGPTWMTGRIRPYIRIDYANAVEAPEITEPQR